MLEDAPPASTPALSARIAKTPGRPVNGRSPFRFRDTLPAGVASRRPFYSAIHQPMPFQRRAHPDLAKHSRRPSGMSEDAQLILVSIIAALLLAGGLFLAFGVGGWLAVTGGILLALVGMAVGLIVLYAFAYTHQH